MESDLRLFLVHGELIQWTMNNFKILRTQWREDGYEIDGLNECERRGPNNKNFYDLFFIIIFLEKHGFPIFKFATFKPTFSMFK